MKLSKKFIEEYKKEVNIYYTVSLGNRLRYSKFADFYSFLKNSFSNTKIISIILRSNKGQEGQGWEGPTNEIVEIKELYYYGLL